MIVNFTTQEAQTTLQLFDLAVKAGGLQVAEAALILSKKIQDASNAPVESTDVGQNNS